MGDGPQIFPEDLSANAQRFPPLAGFAHAEAGEPVVGSGFETGPNQNVGVEKHPSP